MMWLITHEQRCYLFYFISTETFFQQTLLSYIPLGVFGCTNANTSSATAKCQIRRIIPVTDSHHWSVVYHSYANSFLTQFGLNFKIWCRAMLDKE